MAPFSFQSLQGIAGIQTGDLTTKVDVQADRLESRLWVGNSLSAVNYMNGCLRPIAVIDNVCNSTRHCEAEGRGNLLTMSWHFF